MPAVSESRRQTSPSWISSLTTSRVVPGIWVTMELSNPHSRFIKVDLPTLGLPAITVSTPRRTIRPRSNPFISRSISSPAACRRGSRAAASTSGISSSGKSAQAPSQAAALSRFSFTADNRLASAPSWAATAARAA